jgi:hypothetical protein
VTATVESIPLITASILSKKLAAGLDGLVMDVKVGNGAFMQSDRDAKDLARSIVGVAGGAGVPTTALLTDMDQPLADAAGNSLEVAYALDYLTGARRQDRMHAVVLELGAEMLVVGGLAEDVPAGRAALQASLDSGEAADRFSRMVRALGGPKDLLTKPSTTMEKAPVVVEVTPARTGVVTKVDTRSVGLAVVSLGGGRTRPQDRSTTPSASPVSPPSATTSDLTARSDSSTPAPPTPPTRPPPSSAPPTPSAAPLPPPPPARHPSPHHQLTCGRPRGAAHQHSLDVVGSPARAWFRAPMASR